MDNTLESYSGHTWEGFLWRFFFEGKEGGGDVIGIQGEGVFFSHRIQIYREAGCHHEGANKKGDDMSVETKMGNYRG